MHSHAAAQLLRCLEEEGVEVIFGYPGGAVLPIYDALVDAPIRHILVRHEQGAVHAADGYARASGRVGVCLATSGPGATNLVTGLATAYMDSVPMVALTGQVARALVGSDAFQEADVLGISRAVTKHNFALRNPADLPRVVHEAFHLARSGRPGPVLIDLPKDVMLAEAAFPHPQAPPVRRGYHPRLEPDPAQVEAAARALAEAERPVVMVGGGVVAGGAAGELRRFLERTGFPAVSTLMGLGALPAEDGHHLGLVGMHGTYAANRAVSQADLVLGLGLRFDDRVTGNASRFAPHARIVHVDIDPSEIGKNVRADLPVLGDLIRVLPRLLDRLAAIWSASGRSDLSAWWAALAAWQAHQGWNLRTPMELGGEGGRPLRPQGVIQQVARVAGPEAIIATDVGQHQMWTALLFPFRRPRQLVTSGGLGTMGFGLPAAIGAQLAEPERPVWLVTGDGSFQMNVQEMATAVNYGLPLRVVIVDNRSLGMVRQWQELFHQERYSAVMLEPLPDWVRLAAAYGWQGWKVERAADLEPALEALAASSGPALVDVVVDAQENVFPMVPAGAALDEVLLEKPGPRPSRPAQAVHRPA
ncbi:MAG: biosynthetic-type acetolactate synthase large subunit [Bacillota bacterium]|nr:biosynthetic-type acetolactate synthase large subunit [Bacillota bacterium]